MIEDEQRARSALRPWRAKSEPKKALVIDIMIVGEVVSFLFLLESEDGNDRNLLQFLLQFNLNKPIASEVVAPQLITYQPSLSPHEKRVPIAADSSTRINDADAAHF